MAMEVIRTYGNLTADPEFNTNRERQRYAILRIATNPNPGERVVLSCTAKGDLLQVAEILKKGDRVALTGSLRKKQSSNGILYFVSLRLLAKCKPRPSAGEV